MAIFTPENPTYTSILQAYIRNLRFATQTTRKPLLILAATHVSHVQAAVLAARKHGVLMKIRSGGHCFEGTSYVSDTPFFILDMHRLRAIDVDVESETAWVQTGATLGELFFRIQEKSRVHGFPAGVCPTVGVGGHFLGGGYGNMMRKYGLSVDNIIDAELVDAKCRILDRKTMGEDLFWAIRGGGASFGVVIAYKVNLVKVPENVTVFKVARTLEEKATEVVYQWQHVAHKIDEDLFIRIFIDVMKMDNNIIRGTGRRKTVRATFVGMFLGQPQRLLSILKKSFPQLGLLKSDCIQMGWLESILFWSDYPIGTQIDTLLSRTPGVLTHLKRKSDYVQEPISKENLERIWKKMMELEIPMLGFNPYGGKMAEISPTSTPFPHRGGNLWKIQYLLNWEEEGKEAIDYYLDLARKMHSFMTPFVSKNPRAAFINYKDLDLGINLHGKESYEEGRVYGICYFKENFNRLVHIKTRVDPANFFRHEQSIPTLPYSRS